jgi:hypothetical protein
VSVRTDDRDAILAAWRARDAATAPLRADGRAIDESSAIRNVIVDLARHEGRDEELYDACAVLGRLVAECGGSATLCALTLEHAAEALGAIGRPWLAPARAALVEGYTRALQERARLESLAAWDFPSCAVRVDDTAVAIAASFPSEDDEAVSAWAAKTANAIARAGYRRALVSGSDRCRSALSEALGLAGIESTVAPSLVPARTRSSG